MNISGERKLPMYFYRFGWLALFSIVLSVGLLRHITKEEEVHSFWSYIINTTEAESLVSGKRETKALLKENEAGLLFDDFEAAYDQDTGIFYISQPSSEENWQGDIKPYGAELYILEDGYTEQLFRAVQDGHIFEALLCKEEEYQKIGIVLTGMPVVKIDTKREEEREYPVEDIDNYVFNSETRYYGDITVFQAGTSAFVGRGEETESEYKILQRKVSYHERGQNSALFGKKSYAVKLLNQKENEAPEPVFGMRRSADWKLLAMYSDPNKIRDKVSMELWKEIAEKEKDFNERGPEMEYCEVILDKEYLGLYGMMLPVNEETLELGADDVLYKIMDWYMPEDADIQASVDQDYEVCYPIRIRYPEKGSSTEKLWEPIREYFSNKYWNLDFKSYAKMSYVENLADYYIFIQTVSGFDNYLKNTYISALDMENEEGYKMVTIPWDLNYTFGNCYSYDPEMNYTVFNEDSRVDYVEPVLEQLFRSSLNGEAEVLKERWNRYRSGILSTEHITELLQGNMDYIQETGAFSRDTEKWEEALNSSDLSEVKKYVEERMDYLDEYFGDF